MQTPLETAALVGALALVQLVGLAVVSARRRLAPPALYWWAAALAVEALRLALVSVPALPPSAARILIGSGGDAVIALLVLAGTFDFIGRRDWRRWPPIGASVAAVAAIGGSLSNDAASAMTVALAAGAAICFGAAGWAFWGRFRAERRGACLLAACAASVTATVLLGGELAAMAGFAPSGMIAGGPWWLIAHVGLSLLMMTGLIAVSQDRVYARYVQTEERADRLDERLKGALEGRAGLEHAQRIAHLGSWQRNLLTSEATWSDEAYRIFGYEPQAAGVSEKHFLARVHPDDRSAVTQAADAAVAGVPYDIEYRIVLPGATERILRERAEIQFDESGNAAVQRGTVQDVSESRKERLGIRWSQDLSARLGRILDVSSYEIYTFDAETLRFVQANHGARQNLGYTMEELAQLTPIDLAPELDHESFLGIVAPLRKGTQDDVTFETTHKRRDGSLYPVEAHVQHSTMETPPVFVAIIRDITERRRAAAALQQRIGFLELSKVVAGAANEATTADQALQVALHCICQHTGWPVGHVYLLAEDGSGALVPTQMWHLDDTIRYEAFRKATMGQTLAPGEGLAGRVLEQRAPIWIENILTNQSFEPMRRVHELGARAILAVPLTIGPRVVGVLEFLADQPHEPDPITLDVMTHVGHQLGRVIERADAVRDLNAAKEAVESANRAKGEFLATMSHELRTPLNAIIGFSDIICGEILGPLGHPDYKEYLHDIRDGGTHLLNLINDILDVSKCEVGQLKLFEEAVDLAVTLQESLAEIRPQAEKKGLALDAELPDQRALVRCDKRRLKQVLNNLLTNAVKFTAKGRVRVKLSGGLEDGICLEIGDTGLGIAESDLEKVFDPFTQANSTFSRAHAGAGIGLPLSRSLVELHGGRLTIESVFGEGTTATVWLPPERVVGSADAA